MVLFPLLNELFSETGAVQSLQQYRLHVLRQHGRQPLGKRGFGRQIPEQFGQAGVGSASADQRQPDDRGQRAHEVIYELCIGTMDLVDAIQNQHQRLAAGRAKDPLADPVLRLIALIHRERVLVGTKQAFIEIRAERGPVTARVTGTKPVRQNPLARFFFQFLQFGNQRRDQHRLAHPRNTFYPKATALILGVRLREPLPQAL